MRAAIFAFTKNGVMQGINLLQYLRSCNFEAAIYAKEEYRQIFEDIRRISPELKSSVHEAFGTCKLIVFIGALGIAVRSIAPFLQDKTKDPAVLCMDDLGQFVIPVISGHIGGANDFARKISAAMHATAIITTATDCNGAFSVDEWATKQGMHICDMNMAKQVAKCFLEGTPVGLNTAFGLAGSLPKGMIQSDNCRAGIAIALGEKKKPYQNTLTLLPRIVHIGIGCRKNATFENIENAVLQVLAEDEICINAVCAISSIDLKKEETGLLAFAKRYSLPISFYTAEQLKNVQGEFTKSDFVKEITSIDNVCERAAGLSSDNGRIIRKKTVVSGVTIALAIAKWSVCFDN